MVVDCRASTLDIVSLIVEFVARAQALDAEVQAFRTNTTGLQIDRVHIDDCGTSLHCGLSLGYHRPIAPKIFQRHVFENSQYLPHPNKKINCYSRYEEIFLARRKKADRQTGTKMKCLAVKLLKHSYKQVRGL